LNSLYSGSIFDTIFPSMNMNRKSVALSTRKALGQEAIEYAQAMDADLLLIFGYAGFNDIIYKTYLPLSEVPPVYSQPFMKGFATVGLVDGHTGALLWTDNGDDEHQVAWVNSQMVTYPPKSKNYSLDESIERALRDALSTLPSKN